MTPPSERDKTARHAMASIPSMTTLLDAARSFDGLADQARAVTTAAIREASAALRQRLKRGESVESDVAAVLGEARDIVAARASQRLVRVINATGIVLHTGLGRSVLPDAAIERLTAVAAGYCNLEIDLPSGKRGRRGSHVERLLCELTGAEAALVVNNNAAATMLVLAALAAEREVVISRGQLIEIGGAFRLPDVMVQSRVRMVEVGTTNRTHLRDYAGAITEETAAVLRVHPSNYRVVGFVSQPSLAELAELAHARGLVLIDDLGAGALVDLEPFGLPHEPTMGESVAAGADVVLASADKLIGAAQGGVIVGTKACVDRIRKHPLARAFRADKTCLMALERTLALFRDEELLKREHPLYRMLATPIDELGRRAEALADAIRNAAPDANVEVADGVGYLGSGSLPMEALPTRLVRVTAAGLKPEELARRLRMDEAAVFTRIEDDRVLLDVRTIHPGDVERVAQAVGRAAEQR
jgi:L-seryl-tRNA(Ser) seleniumtransferase